MGGIGGETIPLTELRDREVIVCGQRVVLAADAHDRALGQLPIDGPFRCRFLKGEHDLDVSVLQERVLGPVLGVGDPAHDTRLSFVGAVEGTAALERRAGGGGVAFALCPTTVSQLMTVADAGLLMPPKSTWFEPKLPGGLFVRRVSHRESVLDGTRRALGE